MDRRLEKYISDHSSPEDPVLSELYRETHTRFVNPNMASGHLQGLLLELIARMIRPIKILEIGTYTGYSAICLAKGLMPGGKLITIEMNDELSDFSNYYFEKSGFGEVIQLLNGRAQDVIPGIEGPFDLVYIDGDKREYAEYFRLIFGKTSQGGYILADNVLWAGKILDGESRDLQTRGVIEFNEMIKNQSGIEQIILPLWDGLMLIRKE